MRTRKAIVALCLATLAWLPTAGAIELQIEFTGVEGPLLENVKALSSLHRLSASEELDEEMVGRLAQRAPGEAKAALRPFGYYAPAVATEVEQVDGIWKVRVSIDPGSPVILAEQQFEITGAGRDEKFMREALTRSPLRTGEKLSHAAYDQLKGDLLRAALGHGYLDAGFTRAELLVDPEARTARALVTLDTGERYRFGPTTIEQDTLREELIRRYLRYSEGDWYHAEALLRTQFALDDSQYFSLVEVLPEDRDRKNKVAPVRISSKPNRQHVYTIAAGYATDTGPRGTLGWQNRRFNDRGHRVRAQVRASEIESSVAVAYIIPWKDPALEKLSFELRGFDEQNGDIETTGGTFKVGLTQVRGGWQRVLSVTADHTEDEITTVTDGSTIVDRKRSQLLVPGITFARLPPDFLGVNAVPKGFQVELLASTEEIGSDTNFTRILVSDERRFRLADKWRLRLRGEIGASAVGDFQELPAQYRFFAGGDQSVRGYGYEELSPVDANGNKVGGRHLITGSVELQKDLPRSFVAAVFIDAGNAVDKIGDPLEYSVGIGLRYRLPFLSIGVDVAQSISETDRSPRLHVNFTPEF